MNLIWALQGGVTMVAALALLAVKLFAFVDALTRRPDAFVAAGKMTKQAWLLILGLSALAAVLFPQPIGLFSIVGTVASFVYLLEARPAVVEVTRRR
jgi:hypothetical protein